MKIKEMVQNLRKEYGLTQKELANLLHVDFTTVSQWENGKRMIKAEMLELMLEKLNVEVIFKKKECVDFIRIPIEKVEEAKDDFKDWHNEGMGGNFVCYFKEMKRKNDKKVIVNTSNVVKDAWVVYKDETKSEFISLNELEKREDLEDIDEITSEILTYYSMDDDFVNFEVTALGNSLFDIKILNEIAFCVAKMTY